MDCTNLAGNRWRFRAPTARAVDSPAPTPFMTRIGSTSVSPTASISFLPHPARAWLAHESIECQARSTPQATAVVHGVQSLSYQSLDERANALAERLTWLGVGPDRLVGIFLDRSFEMVISLLAVMKAGGAFLPFDADHPRERLRCLLSDARPRWIITHHSLADSLPVEYGMTIKRERDRLIVMHCADKPALNHRPPAQRIRADYSVGSAGSRLAYAIYTSGTSGEPKAALLTHAGLANLIAAERRLLRLGPGRRVLQFASLAFDAAIWEIFAALASGATVVLADRSRLLPGENLRRTVELENIDTLTLPPSVLEMLGPPGLPGLTTLIVAGEACPSRLASQWSVGRRFINAYGPTEATVCATAYECPAGEQSAPPLGEPLPGVELLLLDDRLQPVGDGRPGELCIAGAGLARGYMNRPKLTAEKFIRHPLVNDHDGRLYRTGDLVRRRADGRLEFLGRIDRQVKIHGVRIELDEISTVLTRHPDVRAATTLATGDRRSRHLASFVIPRAESSVSTASLRCWLRARLPAAMLPSLTLVSHWPLTANGKLDETSLLALETAKKKAKPAGNSSRSRIGTTAEICDLFRQQLQVPFVGPDDDFFELGGNSLQAAELLARIGHRFGHSLTLGDVVTSSTAAALAQRLADGRCLSGSTIVVPLHAGGTRPPLFVVHPAGGSVACYRALARALGHDQACYGLQSPALVGDEPPTASIGEMAERYLDEVAHIAPRGACLLAGWSLGGIVAYEMAHRLRTAGRDVPALILIDSGILFSFQLLRRFISPDEVPPFLWNQADRERMYAHVRRECPQLIPTTADECLARRCFDVFWANVEAAYHYSPPDSEGPMTLVVGNEAQSKYHPAREWRRSCQTVHVHELAANHLELLQPPYVNRVAHIIQSSIENQ
jgi:amino acid adenylation domain-containing protein